MVLLWKRIPVLVSAFEKNMWQTAISHDSMRTCVYNYLTNTSVRFKALGTSFKCTFPVCGFSYDCLKGSKPN